MSLDTSPSQRRSDRRVNLAALVILIIVVVVGGAVVWRTSRSTKHTATTRSTAEAGVSTTQKPIFSSDSVWNKPLAANAPIASDSATLVANLLRQVNTDGTWIDTDKYSVPVYTVSGSQPKVPVTLDTSGAGPADELAKVFASGVPIPADATAAPGTDEHLVVLQPSTDTMWEFWEMHKVDGRWHARWGGRMPDYSTNPGYFDDPPDWGATATSLPLMGGLMLLSELRRGEINHALSFAVVAASPAHVFPAQRSDGYSHEPDAIPEGTELRIPASVDLAGLHLPHLTLIMARAVQRYGMILRDQSGAVTFYAQQPPAGTDPFAGESGYFEGKYPNNLLASFPWKDLQVVKPRGSG